MKASLLLSLFLFACASVLAQSSEKLYVGAGATFNKVNGIDFEIDNSIGYYANLGILKEVTKHVDVAGELSYQNQHIKLTEDNFNVNSVNLGFNTKIYPLKKATSILLGFQAGLVFSDIEGVDKGNFAFNTGLSHRIEHIEFVAKLNHVISDTFFDKTIQFGINYHF